MEGFLTVVGALVAIGVVISLIQRVSLPLIVIRYSRW